ncbi:hypothetical protein [Paenibacillus sp. CCS19]|uniref:hypothetical protein n=1 Tax=Paenibacillus sp. CCS19 TaxID=3158387 RepID=UPI00295EAC8C|nr:hypothetical protein [Paenibacillus cellulosilyticus]
MGWQSESDGFATGTEGHVSYIFDYDWQSWSQVQPGTVFDHRNQNVTAISRNPNQIDLFVIGFDNAVWTTWWEASIGWAPGGWFQIHPETVFDHTTQQVTAIARGTGHLDLFVIGFDNAVWSTWWDAVTGWAAGGWVQIHAETTFDHTKQKITAVSRNESQIDLFVIGFDNAVWSIWWEAASGWSPSGWFQIHPGTFFDHTTQKITAISRNPNHLDLFVIGFDNAVWSTWWEPAIGWANWFQIHAGTVFDHTKQEIAAITRNPDQIDLFVIGFDNAVWSTWWETHSGWAAGGWIQIHPETRFDHTTQKITALSRHSNQIDLFVVGLDNAIWSTWWEGQSGWATVGWLPIHNETVFDHTTQRIAALARSSDHIDLFIIGFDNVVWKNWWGTRASLNIRWDNPFVGLNNYHHSVSPGYGLSGAGGKGNNTETIYTLQTDAPVRVPGFLPSTNGLPFGNNWPSASFGQLRLPPFSWWGDGISLGDASNGLCGGMTYAVIDYFEAHQRPPQHRPAVEGDPIFHYFVRRLFDSFNSPMLGSCDPLVCGGFDVLANVKEFMTLTDSLYPNSDNYISDGFLGDGKAWKMARSAWPAIQQTIDSGKLCPIGLVMVKSLLPSDLGQNHQVLVYGYQLRQTQLTLFICDPNSPLDDHVTATLNIEDTGEPIDVTHNVDVGRPIYAFFPLRYSFIAPVGGTP